jgi:hypothetical protein
MSIDLYMKLSWLPPAPDDFAARCRALLDAPVDAGSELRALASFGLDENQLTRLSKVILKLQKAGKSLAPLTSFRLGILSTRRSISSCLP